MSHDTHRKWSHYAHAQLLWLPRLNFTWFELSHPFSFHSSFLNVRSIRMTILSGSEETSRSFGYVRPLQSTNRHKLTEWHGLLCFCMSFVLQKTAHRWSGDIINVLTSESAPLSAPGHLNVTYSWHRLCTTNEHTEKIKWNEMPNISRVAVRNANNNVHTICMRVGII